ncbi:MAG: glycosyltransferase family 2 protein [Bacteroidales bacterium]|nr:glycosyltransferase family 2 protein [Bacteroidales bacterium]
MLKNKTVAVVVPAYNEEKQIGMVIETMPDFVDRIIIVNDFSKDNTKDVVAKYIATCQKSNLPVVEKRKNNIYNRAEEMIEQRNIDELKLFVDSEVFNDNSDDKIVLINLLKNGGVGAAIARGYKWCKDNNIDCTAVMAGDGQMDPDELESICMPVVEEGIDYVKGNRLIHPSASMLIPKTRFFGNSVLSILTKIASGYWHVSDTQTGYTAMSKRAINAIPLHKIYKRYGMPNDVLVKLNIAFCSLREIEIKPIYNVGEKSKMKVLKVISPILWLLFKSFFKRLWNKYLLKSFHPLFILYFVSFSLLLVSIPFGVKILSHVFNYQDVNPVTVMAFIFLSISGLQSLLFAMWMDIQDNERLYK